MMLNIVWAIESPFGRDSAILCNACKDAGKMGVRMYLQDGADNDEAAQSGGAHGGARVHDVIHRAAHKEGQARPQHERRRRAGHTLPFPLGKQRRARKHERPRHDACPCCHLAQECLSAEDVVILHAPHCHTPKAGKQWKLAGQHRILLGMMRGKFGTDRVGSGRRMQHVQMALPGDLDEVGA